jgi:hypothetical protein
LRRDPALRVHHWGYGQRDSGNRKAGAAGAAGVATANNEEVLVLDVTPCSLGLDILQHEEVLWAPINLLFILLSLGRKLLSDCLKVEGH